VGAVIHFPAALLFVSRGFNFHSLAGVLEIRRTSVPVRRIIGIQRRIILHIILVLTGSRYCQHDVGHALAALRMVLKRQHFFFPPLLSGICRHLFVCVPPPPPSCPYSRLRCMAGECTSSPAFLASRFAPSSAFPAPLTSRIRKSTSTLIVILVSFRELTSDRHEAPDLVALVTANSLKEFPPLTISETALKVLFSLAASAHAHAQPLTFVDSLLLRSFQAIENGEWRGKANALSSGHDFCRPSFALT
jgi:hypothetical protein